MNNKKGGLAFVKCGRLGFYKLNLWIMMLRNLQLLNFRNYSDLNLDFCKGLNCLTGLNGCGKTNLLDAIHYLSMTRSFFHASDSQSVKHGESSMMVRGEFVSDASADVVLCAIKSGQKKTFKFNDVEYDRLSDHIGLFPIVVIAPSDIELALGGGEGRRRFMDSLISQYNRNYLQNLIRYSETLSQRNSLLKQFAAKGYADWSLMSIYDEQLDASCRQITNIRQEFVGEFNPVFIKYYDELSDGKETPGLSYMSHISGGKLIDKLVESRSKDLDIQYTSVGCHRDDLEFEANGLPLKKYASQGQLKTYMCAIRLAQFELLSRHSGKKPLLLLDDVFDRLDNSRVHRLLELVCSTFFGQVFLSHTDMERLQVILTSLVAEFRIFDVKDHQVYTRPANL